MMRRAVVCVAVLATCTLSGCSKGPSPEAFCGVVDDNNATYTAAAQITTSARTVGEGITAAGGMIGALQLVDDAVKVSQEMAEAAPKDVASDMTYLAEQAKTFREQFKDSRGNVDVRGFDGRRIDASARRVMEYVNATCD